MSNPSVLTRVKTEYTAALVAALARATTKRKLSYKEQRELDELLARLAVRIQPPGIDDIVKLVKSG